MCGLSDFGRIALLIDKFYSIALGPIPASGWAKERNGDEFGGDGREKLKKLVKNRPAKNKREQLESPRQLEKFQFKNFGLRFRSRFQLNSRPTVAPNRELILPLASASAVAFRVSSWRLCIVLPAIQSPP